MSGSAKAAASAAAAVVVLAGSAWWWARSAEETPVRIVAEVGKSSEESLEISSSEELAGVVGGADASEPVLDRTRETLEENESAIGLAQGRVIDTSGQPIEGATVLSWRDAGGEAVRAFDLPPEQPRATTDADGRFAFDTGAVEVTGHRLLVEAEGFSPADHPWLPGDPGQTIVLARATILRGTVRNLTGDPVGGAVVRFLAWVGRFGLERQTVSKSDGSYELATLSYGVESMAALEVRHEDYSTLLFDFRLEDPAGEQVRDLWLERGSPVTGFVRDAESGRGIAGAQVLLESATLLYNTKMGGRSQDNPLGVRLLAETVTDGEGRYRLEHSPSFGVHPSGEHEVLMGSRTAGHLRAVLEGRISEQRKVPMRSEGEASQCDLEVFPAVSIRGHVLPWDSEVSSSILVFAESTGGPFEGRLPWRTNGRSWIGEVGAGGEFLLPAVAVAPRTPLRIAAEGTAGGRPITGELALEWNGEAALEVEIPLSPVSHPAVLVRVRDPEGRPVPTALVKCVAGDETLDEGVDGRGEVVLTTDSREPSRGQVVVEAPGFVPERTDTIAFGPEPAEVSVTLRRAVSLEGRVVDSRGEPAPSVRIIAWNAELDPSRLARARFLDDEVEGLVTRLSRDVTQEDGSFRLAVPADDVVHLAFWFDGESTASKLVTDVSFDDSPIEVALPGSAPPVARERSEPFDCWFRVRRADGGPMLHPDHFELERSGDRRWPKQVTPGEYRLALPEEGDWSLLLRASGHVPVQTTINVTRDSAPLELVLEAGGRGRFQVQASDGSDLRAFRWFLSDRNRKSSMSGEFSSGTLVEADAMVEGGMYRLSMLGSVDGVSLWWTTESGTYLSKTAEGIVEPVTVHPAGIVSMSIDCGHLPYLMDVGDDTELERSRGTVLEVIDERGRLYERYEGLTRREFGFIAPEGNVTLRLSVPGHQVREQRVTVSQRERVEVVLRPDS